MHDSSPKVSVVMSVYNGSCYLRESIESVLNQTFHDFEFIIIDDGSTDESWDVLTQYAEGDQRIRLVQNECNIGLTKSLNEGLRLAQGTYIARQDADDISLPQRFEKQVRAFEQYSDAVLVSSNIELIDAEGHFLKTIERNCSPELVVWYLLFHNHLAGHSQVMFRRSPVQVLGGYDEAYRYSQDYELWCRLSKVGKVFILSETLLQQRSHNQSISAAKRSEQTDLVLNQVVTNVKHLTGKMLSPAEADALRRLWTGHLRGSRFPDRQQIGTVNSLLKIVYAEFTQKHLRQSEDTLQSCQELRTLIGNRFIAWANTISLQKNFIVKVKLLLCAFSWYPAVVIGRLHNKFGKDLTL